MSLAQIELRFEVPPNRSSDSVSPEATGGIAALAGAQVEMRSQASKVGGERLDHQHRLAEWYTTHSGAAAWTPCRRALRLSTAEVPSDFAVVFASISISGGQLFNYGGPDRRAIAAHWLRQLPRSRKQAHDIVGVQCDGWAYRRCGRRRGGKWHSEGKPVALDAVGQGHCAMHTTPAIHAQ